MTVIQKKAVNPIAHLTAEDIETLGRELDAIRDRVIADRGERDAAYIRKVIATQRKLELGSRAVLLFSLFPPAWLVGTAGLSVAKILENMEIGHNVLHGQWDWMRDPKIHSTTWEWDHVSPAEQWKHSHNELHHTYTNVIGKDNDLGYGIMRVDEDQPLAPDPPGPAAVELRQRLLLRVRHRRVRPGAGQEPATRRPAQEPGVPGPRPGGRPQDPQPGAQGLRRPPAAVRPVVPAHPGRHLHRQPGPQPVDPLGDHVRALPGGRRDLRADARSRARPAASGTCGRCSARPTSAAAG